MVCKFFDKKPSVTRANKFSGGAVKSEITLNQQSAEELRKRMIRKFEKSKVHSSFTVNTWHTDLANMQFISTFNRGIRFLLCVIDIFSKYAWVVPLKDKKGITVDNVFQNILDESGRKPSEIWVDKGSEFYNRSLKPWLQDNNIEIYSPYNEGKSVVAERFIRTLKKKIYKYMTSVSKNIYIDELDDTVNSLIKGHAN